MISATSTIRYSIDVIKEEACNLVENNVVTKDQPLRILCEYLPAGQWRQIECELERYDYLLRDHIIDLIGNLNWDDD